MLALRKESAAILRDIKELGRNMTLLDIYEPGMTVDASPSYSPPCAMASEMLWTRSGLPMEPDLGIMSRHVPTAVQRRISSGHGSYRLSGSR